MLIAVKKILRHGCRSPWIVDCHYFPPFQASPSPILTLPSPHRAVTHIETLLAHAGVKPTSASPGLSPTIDPSTTFLREADGSYASGHIYSRISNPSRATLEEAVAALEVAGSSSSSSSSASTATATPPPTASAFSSGLAAASAIMMAHSPNCHVVLPDDCYHGVPAQLVDVMENLGVSWTPCDMTNVSEVTECIE